ncbi:MAG: tetratricopeptide repeat protein [Actinobacteria bacterium]|nr:tetratricopeptide repeat protein [Actinomycetota bacterium]
MAKLPSQFNRAFDLSSLKEPPSIPGGTVIEANERIFVEQLIPLSKQKLVVVVLWTPRSSESVALVDLLTRISREAEQSHAWQLATVNADVESAIVEALRATGVPTTIALIAGQVAPLFEGLIPPEQLSELLEKVVELAKKQGVAGGASESNPAEEVEEPEVIAAYGALAVNDLARAQSEFEKLLARKPNDKDALQGLANIALLTRITGHDGGEVMAKAESDAHDIENQKIAADFQFLSGDISGAFSRLINLIQLTVGDERESIRLQVLSLFAMLEPGDPELVKARSALARALF